MQMDHFLTTIFHTLTCVFIYTGFGANDVSFWASMLFAFNPANNQGSVWISGRSYVLPALGMTLALTFPALAFLPLLGATYFNAGFLAPVVLVASQAPWVVLFVPLCWAFHFKRFKLNVGRKVKKEMFTEDRRIHWRKLVLFTKTFGFYLTHSLIPIKTAFYHSFLQSAAGCGKQKAQTMKDRFFWIGLIGLLFMGLHLFYTNWNTASFGLIWFCVGILPFLNLVRIHQEIGERYMYLPNVGLMIFLSYHLMPYPTIRAVLLAVYATKLWFHMDAYQDDYYLVEFSRLHSPDAWFGWHVAGMKRWDTGSHKEAIILWTMARMISPNEYKLNFNLATAMRLAKQDKEAAELMKIAMTNVPGGQERESKKLYDEWVKGNLSILL
jgi:hypothetical protein